MSKPEAPKRSRLMDALRPPAEAPAPAPEAAPIPSSATTDLTRPDKPEEIVNLNFKVPKSFFRSFSIMARELDMKNNGFLVELLDSYTRANAERFGNLSPEMTRRNGELKERANKG